MSEHAEQAGPDDEPTPAKSASLPPPPNLPSLKRGLFASVAYALDGVLRTLVTQRNMKIHWVSALAVMLVGMALELDLASRASVMFCVIMVLSMEVLNSALEAFVDLHVHQYLRTAMVAKDAAAAAVLILMHRWRLIGASAEAVLRTVVFGVPLLILVGLSLIIQRNMARLTAMGAISVGLLTYLAWYSRDEVFSLGALSFVAFAQIARWREPHLTA